MVENPRICFVCLPSCCKHRNWVPTQDTFSYGLPRLKPQYTRVTHKYTHTCVVKARGGEQTSFPSTWGKWPCTKCAALASLAGPVCTRHKKCAGCGQGHSPCERLLLWAVLCVIKVSGDIKRPDHATISQRILRMLHFEQSRNLCFGLDSASGGAHLNK